MPPKSFEGFKTLSYPAEAETSSRFAYPSLWEDSRFWQAGVEITSPTSATLITRHGLEGGKIQESRREISLNKSKRDIYQKSLLDLNQAYNLRIRKHGLSFEKGAKKLVSKEGEAPFAMLAQTYSPSAIAKIPFPVYVQPKLDGVRLLVDLVDGKPRYSSRERSNFSHLSVIFDAEALCLFSRLPTGSVLDGELIVPGEDGGEDFQVVTGAARKIKGGLSDAAMTRMQYHVFGFFTMRDLSLNFAQRTEILSNAFDACRSPFVKVIQVPTFTAATTSDVEKALKMFTLRGHEGVMIYNLAGVYEPSKRSWDLLKYKTFDESEGLIVSVKPGRGRESNAALVNIEVSPGNIVTMHPTGSIEEREKWLLNPSLVVGKKMTYTFQGLTKGGLPRFPVARTIRDYE
jgi:ATP-dependent DNA ligase